MRALGEDLVLFRDKHGRAGLLHARCCHRGTTLYYGKVEEDGIRCCYHGWKFDTEGHCLEQPCEPDGGQFKDKVRQPWYPVEERYGLIFAYMGPAEKKPVLPRLRMPGERWTTASSSRPTTPRSAAAAPPSFPATGCSISRTWSIPTTCRCCTARSAAPQFTNMMASMPEVKFETSPRGVTVRSIRKQDDGKVFYRVTEAALPTLARGAQSARRAIRPRRVDRLDAADRRHLVPHLCRRPRQAFRRHRPHALEVQRQVLVGHDAKREHQQFPGDYEAQVGQGPITIHSEEHFGQSDRGILMIRRMLSEQLEAMEAGRDPIGVSFDPQARAGRIRSGELHPRG